MLVIQMSINKQKTAAATVKATENIEAQENLNTETNLSLTKMER